MLERLKMPIDKLFYEKINEYGLLFYIFILSIAFIIFLIMNLEENTFVIFLSVITIFLQMNYNIYDSKLKKENELNLKTMEIIEQKYININVFITEEEQRYLNTLIDGDYNLTKIIIEEDTFPLELKEKLLKQYNLIEYLCILVQKGLISKNVFSVLMGREIKYWASRLQLLSYIGGRRPEYLIKYALDSKIISKESLHNLDV